MLLSMLWPIGVVQVTYVNSTLNFFFILSCNKFLTLTCMFSLSIICSLYLFLSHFYWLLLSFAHQAFESPHTHSSCFSFLRQYADDSFSRAACVVAPKSIISYPQVTFKFFRTWMFNIQGFHHVTSWIPPCILSPS